MIILWAKYPQLVTIKSCCGGTLLAQDVKSGKLSELDKVLSVMDFMMFQEVSHYAAFKVLCIILPYVHVIISLNDGS